MDTSKKQPLPYAVDKKNLFAMYTRSSIPEREIRRGINAIIADNRNIEPTKAASVKNIWHNELMQFVETYGLPKGYYKTETV